MEKINKRKIARAERIPYRTHEQNRTHEQRMNDCIAHIESVNEKLRRNIYGPRKETTGNMTVEEKVKCVDYAVEQMAKSVEAVDSRLDNGYQLVKSYSNVDPYDSGVDSTDYMDR